MNDMKVVKLCAKCAENPNVYVNGTVVDTVPESECPNCKTKQLVRLASVTWLMTCFGAAISVLLYYSWSVKAAEKFGIDVHLCNFTWLLLFILLLWSTSTAAGKFLYRKFKLMEEEE